MSYASDTLLHYIKTLWEQTDLQWNSDNQAEVESIVESIESTIENQIKQKLQSMSASQNEQVNQELKNSQDAVAMFAEYHKQQLLEQRLIAVATPLLAAMITNQGICLAASVTAQVRVEMIPQGEMVNGSIELATLLLSRISETVHS